MQTQMIIMVKHFYFMPHSQLQNWRQKFYFLRHDQIGTQALVYSTYLSFSCYVMLLYYFLFLFPVICICLSALYFISRSKLTTRMCFFFTFVYLYIIWWCTQNFNVWKKHLCYLLIIFAYNKHLLQLMVEYVNSDTF